MPKKKAPTKKTKLVEKIVELVSGTKDQKQLSKKERMAMRQGQAK